jgi:predicted TIM-barrel fold metal-dependent hydrolase
VSVNSTPDDLIFISADSHFLDPPTIWKDWLPRRYHERAPQLVDDGAGGHGWLYAGATEPEPIGLGGLPGQPPDELKVVGVRYDNVRSGTYNGADRVADQDADGVAAEVIFPSSRPLGHFLDDSDRDFVVAGVHAYNNFVKDEFCAAAPDRLFPVAQLPTTGIEDCTETLRWAAESGFVAAVLPSWPSGGDHLTAKDAVFWKAAEELAFPICIHVSIRSYAERRAWRQIQLESHEQTDMTTVSHKPRASEDTPRPLEFHHRAPNFGIALGKAASILSDLLLSGLFDECPSLQVGLIETWVGWIPRALEALDDIWSKNRYWKGIPLRDKPSSYWYRNLAGSFLNDRAGIATRDTIGVRNMMWSTDYPHFGTFWPQSRDVAMRSLQGLPHDEAMRITARNCVEFYRLEEYFSPQNRLIGSVHGDQ